MKLARSLIAPALAASLLLILSTSPADARGGGRGMGNKGASTQPRGDRSLTQTVNQDQLSDKEVEGLKDQQDALQKAADAMTGEAKLTKDELDTFQAALDAASFYIWSKGADDDNKVMTRYGTNVFPVDALTKLIDAQQLTRPQAKIVLLALKALAAAKLKLDDTLTPEARSSLQRQFNEGLAKYYMLK